MAKVMSHKGDSAQWLGLRKECQPPNRPCRLWAEMSARPRVLSQPVQGKGQGQGHRGRECGGLAARGMKPPLQAVATAGPPSSQPRGPERTVPSPRKWRRLGPEWG